MTRPSWPPPSLELSPSAEVRSLAEEARVEFTDNRTSEASSSEIRRRLIDGEAVPDGWLAPPVVELLCKYRPYR